MIKYYTYSSEYNLYSVSDDEGYWKVSMGGISLTIWEIISSTYFNSKKFNHNKIEFFPPFNKPDIEILQKIIIELFEKDYK